MNAKILERTSSVKKNSLDAIVGKDAAFYSRTLLSLEEVVKINNF